MLFNITVIIVLISSIYYAQTYKKVERTAKKSQVRQLNRIKVVRRDFRGRFIEKDFISVTAYRESLGLQG